MVFLALLAASQPTEPLALASEAPVTPRLALVPLPALDHDAVTAHFNPAGTRLVTVSSGSELRLWHVGEQRVVGTIPLRASGFDVAPDGETMVLGRKRIATVWRRGRSVRELRGHWDWVEGVAVHPDGRQVLTYDDTPRFHRFDLQTGHRIAEPPLPDPGGLLRAWTLTEHHLTWASTRSGVQQFDLRTGQTTALPEVPHDAGALSATPDGRWLAATLTAGPMPGIIAAGASIGVWDLVEDTFVELPGPAFRVALLPNGRTLLAAHEHRVWAIDARTGATLTEVTGDRQVTDLSISADGVVAVATRGGPVQLFRIVYRSP